MHLLSMRKTLRFLYIYHDANTDPILWYILVVTIPANAMAFVSKLFIPQSYPNSILHSQLSIPQASTGLLVPPRVRILELLTLFLQKSQPFHRLAPACFPQRQKGKMPPRHRPRHEVRARPSTIALRLMEIGKRAIRAGLIEPLGYTFQYLGTDRFRGDGRGEEFPVGLGVEVTAVQGQAVALADGVVPVRLDLVDVAGDKASSFCIVVVVAGL